MQRQPNNCSRRGYLRLVVLAATLAGLFLGGLYLGSDKIGGYQLMAIAAVQPLNALALVFIGLRLAVLSNGTASLWTTIKASSLAAVLLYIMPSRLSELIKPIYLADRCQFGLMRGVAIVGVERFIDVAIIAVIGIGGAFLIFRQYTLLAFGLWGAIAIFGTAGMALLLWRPEFLYRLVGVAPFQRLRNALTLLLDELIVSVSPIRLALAILAGLCAWASSFAMVYALIMLSTSVPLDLAAVFLVFLAGTVGLAIAIAPGGVGTFEAGIVIALRYCGVEATEAIVLALLIRAANLGFIPMIAAWVVVADGIGVANLIRIARNALQKPNVSQ